METSVMEIGKHLEEGDLERYSMGAMPEEEAAPFEEHLLICETCRRRVDDCDEFVAALKSAAAQLCHPTEVRVAAAPSSGIQRFRKWWLSTRRG
jgi:anti-sigma factor RsiW